MHPQIEKQACMDEIKKSIPEDVSLLELSFGSSTLLADTAGATPGATAGVLSTFTASILTGEGPLSLLA